MWLQRKRIKRNGKIESLAAIFIGKYSNSTNNSKLTKGISVESNPRHNLLPILYHSTQHTHIHTIYREKQHAYTVFEFKSLSRRQIKKCFINSLLINAAGNPVSTPRHPISPSLFFLSTPLFIFVRSLKSKDPFSLLVVRRLYWFDFSAILGF